MLVPHLKSDLPSDLLAPYRSFLLSPPAYLKFCIRANHDPSPAENSDSPLVLRRDNKALPARRDLMIRTCSLV
jgi:hypothetical protein